MLDRVAARAHDLVDELVGAGDRDGRLIHEFCLDIAPRFGEKLAVSGAEIVKANMVDAFSALSELSLGARGISKLLDRTLVLGAETLFQRGPAHTCPLLHRGER